MLTLNSPNLILLDSLTNSSQVARKHACWFFIVLFCFVFLLLMFFVCLFVIDKHLVIPILKNLCHSFVNSYCFVTDILPMMQLRNSEHHNLHMHFIDIILFSSISCHCNGVVVMYGFLPLLQRCCS